MGHGKDNIKSIFMQGNRGIGEAGIQTIYTLYKDTYPGTIDFTSQTFQDNLKVFILYFLNFLPVHHKAKHKPLLYLYLIYQLLPIYDYHPLILYIYHFYQ